MSSYQNVSLMLQVCHVRRFSTTIAYTACLIRLPTRVMSKDQPEESTIEDGSTNKESTNKERTQRQGWDPTVFHSLAAQLRHSIFVTLSACNFIERALLS